MFIHRSMQCTDDMQPSWRESSDAVGFVESNTQLHREHQGTLHSKKCMIDTSAYCRHGRTIGQDITPPVCLIKKLQSRPDFKPQHRRFHRAIPTIPKGIYTLIIAAAILGELLALAVAAEGQLLIPKDRPAKVSITVRTEPHFRASRPSPKCRWIFTQQLINTDTIATGCWHIVTVCCPVIGIPVFTTTDHPQLRMRLNLLQNGVSL